MKAWVLLSEESAARLGLKRALLVTFAASVTVNVLLATTLLLKGETVRTVLVPMTQTTNEATWSVTDTVPDREYFLRVARDLLTLATFNTPVNVDYHRELLLCYVDAEAFGDIEADLLEAAERLKSQRATIVFETKTMEVDLPNLTVTFIGHRRTFIGKAEALVEPLACRLQMTMRAGRLYLTGLTFHAPKDF